MAIGIPTGAVLYCGALTPDVWRATVEPLLRLHWRMLVSKTVVKEFDRHS